MDFSKVPAWFFGAVLGIAVFIIFLLLYGFSIELPSGGVFRFAKFNTSWIKISDTEPFKVECEYRWKITGEKAGYTGTFVYPSVVRPGDLMMDFSKGSIQSISAKNKSEVSFDGTNYSAEVYRRCQ